MGEGERERWRLILDGRSDGATNMAVDRAIFHSVEARRSPSTLRFYGWSSPTLSLGYAQGAEILDIERCRELGIGIVKRPTGGKAVLHDAEVTFSLSCPIPSPVFPDTLKGSCMTINSCVASGLSSLGSGLELSHPSLKGGTARMACFEGPSAYEIVANGRKLVGCAQRRTHRAFLQHGSIPLSIHWQTLSRLFRDGSLPPMPKAIGLRECLGQGIEEHEVIEALLKSFSEALGVVCELGGLTEEEQELIDCYKKAGMQLTF